MPTYKLDKKFIHSMSRDWIHGYIFSRLETRLKQAIKNRDDEFDLIVQIPKTWFGLRAALDEAVTLPPQEIDSYITELRNISSLFCKKWAIEEINIAPYNQYMELHVHYIRTVKRLTKYQIEQLLGYEIEIVEE